MTDTSTTLTDPLAAMRALTLAQIDQRLADLAAERAQLSTIRRSVVARDKAMRRHAPREQREAVTS